LKCDWQKVIHSSLFRFLSDSYKRISEAALPVEIELAGRPR